jgi:hypothetical protein
MPAIGERVTSLEWALTLTSLSSLSSFSSLSPSLLEKVLFIGTQFSNLSTTVDTSATAKASGLPADNFKITKLWQGVSLCT